MHRHLQLAFTHLVLLEFAGARTTLWLKVKGVDIEVVDLRAWYWHIASEREHNICRLRRSWMDRVSCAEGWLPCER